jgi:hypothetical protein
MTREELPSFLRAFNPAHPPDPRQLVEGFLASQMVYYPGSGSDGPTFALPVIRRNTTCLKPKERPASSGNHKSNSLET